MNRRGPVWRKQGEGFGTFAHLTNGVLHRSPWAREAEQIGPWRNIWEPTSYAFTLTELLVVITMPALLFPALSKAKTRHFERQTCESI